MAVRFAEVSRGAAAQDYSDTGQVWDGMPEQQSESTDGNTVRTRETATADSAVESVDVAASDHCDVNYGMREGSDVATDPAAVAQVEAEKKFAVRVMVLGLAMHDNAPNGVSVEVRIGAPNRDIGSLPVRGVYKLGTAYVDVATETLTVAATEEEVRCGHLELLDTAGVVISASSLPMAFPLASLSINRSYPICIPIASVGDLYLQVGVFDDCMAVDDRYESLVVKSLAVPASYRHLMPFLVLSPGAAPVFGAVSGPEDWPPAQSSDYGTAFPADFFFVLDTIPVHVQALALKFYKLSVSEDQELQFACAASFDLNLEALSTGRSVIHELAVDFTVMCKFPSRDVPSVVVSRPMAQDTADPAVEETEEAPGSAPAQTPSHADDVDLTDHRGTEDLAGSGSEEPMRTPSFSPSFIRSRDSFKLARFESQVLRDLDVLKSSVSPRAPASRSHELDKLHQAVSELRMRERRMEKLVRDYDERLSRMKLLEEENRRLMAQQRKALELEESVLKLKRKLDFLQEDSGLDRLSHADLIEKLLFSRKEVEQARRDLTQLSIALQDASQGKAKADKLAARVKELERAHLEQARYIADMQESQSKLKRYRDTVHQQEAVIQKLEDVMARSVAEVERLQRQLTSTEAERDQLKNHLAMKRGGTGANPEASSKAISLARIQKCAYQSLFRFWKKKALSAALPAQPSPEHLVNSSAPLSAQSVPPQTGLVTTSELEELVGRFEFRAEQAESRSRALEQEMLENTKRFAREMASIRVQLAMVAAQQDSYDFDNDNEDNVDIAAEADLTSSADTDAPSSSAIGSRSVSRSTSETSMLKMRKQSASPAAPVPPSRSTSSASFSGRRVAVLPPT
jgi:hypothetical protein